MTTGFQVLLLIVGLVLLTRGASKFVDKASYIGHAYKLPQVWIGALVVGIGTSLPEFVVSLLSVVNGYPIMAVANVMGSNIANMGLIVGIAGIVGTIRLSKKVALFDVPLSIIPIGILVAGVLSKVVLTWYVGVLLLVVYFMYVLLSSSHRVHTTTLSHGHGTITWSDWGMLVLGLVQVLGGGQITLYFVEELFLKAGLSEVLVGSFLLAVGTSLPELVTTLVAVSKKEASLAVGNILGSNVFNMLGILGASLFFSPLDVGTLFYEAVWLIIISITFLVVARFGDEYRISKREGIVLLSLYILYVGSMLWLAR